MKEVLVTFKHNERYGKVHGIYVMGVDDWRKIQHLQRNNENICLGSVAGKHSEVRADADQFVLVSKNSDEIETFKSLFGKTFGDYAPFDYAMEKYEELTYNEEDEE